MLYERLVLMHELLSEDGSFYVHLAPNVSHTVKLVLDEIFGPTQFRSELIWKRTGAHGAAKRFAPVHDVILYYA